MKALVVGLGSIGKRHVGNLEKLGFACPDIAIVRRKESPNPLGDEFLKDHRGHPIFHVLDEALREHKPDIALITNPNSLHIPAALAAARAGAHLLIEKPLSHSLDGVDELAGILKEKNLVGMVAYNLHFHPALQKAREWLGEGKIGKSYSARAEIAERVTDWHPWEDYRTSYATRNDLGGGVLLTQSHELDYLMWFFGKPEQVFAAGGTKGELGIDVEDTVESIIGFRGGPDVSLHLDYVKRPGVRTFEVAGTNGRIFCDLLKFTTTLIPMEQGAEPITVNSPEGFERNTMYVDELQRFLGCVKIGKAPEVGIEEGKAVLELASAMRKSMETGEVQHMV